MSVATFERELVSHLRGICKNPKLRIKDIMEWSTSEDQVKDNLREHELKIFVPQLSIWVAIPETCNKSKFKP